MATLTNPVSAQNIVDRFADFVVATANTGIVWTSSNKPFTDFDGALLDASSTGKTISINGASITPANGRITASNIYNTLVAETNRYTSIRRLNAILEIGTGAGNATRGAGDALDLTNIAHMAGTAYQGNIGSPANGGVASGQAVNDANLETFFTTLSNSYTAVRNDTIQITVTVCHQSCHASCHGSRGRR